MTAPSDFPQVYDELRRLAAARMAGEAGDHTLDATALVHEAWLRLGSDSFASKSHFLRAAALAMRRILVDHARARGADKRGGDRRRVSLEAAAPLAGEPDDDVLALGDALDKLALTHPLKAELVTLRYFGGLSMAEAAEALDVSVATAERWWAYARAWLFQEIRAGG
jgi:RNA polymerase sigma factor (TIGR02999 family)